MTDRHLGAYAARLACGWPERAAGAEVATLDGTLLKLDLSGFTRLSERLARSQLTGAEELNAVLDDLWTSLIGEVLVQGGDVLQFGGDALAVWFDGPDHELRGAAAAVAVQGVVRRRPAEQTPAGPVRLRMSAGIDSGRFVVGRVGDVHRELVVLGPAMTEVLRLEQAARPGEVLVGPALAAAVTAAGGHVRSREEGAALVSCPPAPPRAVPTPAPSAAAERFLAPEVRELEKAGAPIGEHRLVTIAFLHVGGLDRVVDVDGPGAAQDAAARVASAVERAAADVGVCWTASDLAADGVVYLLVGGAPQSSEQDEERVLRAVRAVVDACSDLQVRAGVHTGRAFAGDVGHPDRRTYAVLGDTTNTAARLMGRAAPGQVLVSRPTYDRSERDHDVGWLGLVDVRGRKQAVEVGALGARVERRRVRSELLPLVGRETEARQVVGTVDRLESGVGGAVLLIGPPGQGKSRLVADALDRARSRGHAVVEAAANPYESSSPYSAIRSVLRDRIPVTPERLRELVVAAGEPERLTPLLALPLGVDLSPTSEVDALDPRFVQRRRDELLAAVLCRAASGPLVLAVEDLHSCDRSTLSFLDVLAEHAAAQPVCVLGTLREAPELWPADADAWQQILLAPLDREQARRLALSAAGDTAIDDLALDRLLDEADGNPLFVRELVAFAGDAGAGLPEDLEQVISARIDTLRPVDRALLRQAAVVGPVADLVLVGEVVGDPSLASPARWSPLHDFVDVSADALRFRHDLYRRTAYAGLAVRRRRSVHAATAARLAEAPDPDPAALAAHLHAAELWAQAHDWGTRAATAARTAGALGDALRLYDAALEAGRRSGAEATALAALAEALGDVADLLGRYEMADRALARAARSGSPAERGRRAVKRAAVVEREGRYRFALRLLTSAERVLPGTEADGALRRAARLRRSSVLHRCGRLLESAALARDVAEQAERAGDRADRARALLRLEMVTSELGLPERFAVGRQALEAFSGVDEPRDLASLLGNLGVTAYESDDWEQAVQRYQESAVAYRRAGDAVGTAFAVNNAAEVLCDQGRLDEAKEGFVEARRVFRAAGHRFGRGCTASSLGRIAARTGSVDEAAALLGEALDELHDMPLFMVDTRLRLVELALLDGDPQVLPKARRSWEDTAAVQAGAVLPLTAQRYLALATAQAGDGGGAVVELEAALAAARSAGVAYEVAACLDHLVALGVEGGREERDRLWTALGVIWTPSYLLRGNSGGT